MPMKLPSDLPPGGLARIAGYLRAAGLAQLESHEDEIALAIGDFLEAMSEKVAIDDPRSLYAYPVPMLSEDGTCSMPDELAPVPYDLAPSSAAAANRPPGAWPSWSGSWSARRRPPAPTGSASTSGA